MAWTVRIWASVPVLLALGFACGALAAPGDRERRCLTVIAYAEAAAEGPAGMLAVMKVVRNRIAHSDFGADACAVALEPGQFQPVGEQPELRRAMAAPEGRSLAEAVGATTSAARLRLVAAWRLAAAVDVWPARNPTGGALYFVSPRLKSPAKCPWFAKLRRTAVIGEHVFMRHYAPGERKSLPALDCARGGRGYTRPGSARQKLARS